jgi:hypothetical protein
MITRSKQKLRCIACDKPMEIDVMRFDNPHAPDMLQTSGWIGVTPEDEDAPGKITVAVVCSDACCVAYLQHGADVLAAAATATATEN